MLLFILHFFFAADFSLFVVVDVEVRNTQNISDLLRIFGKSMRKIKSGKNFKQLKLEF